MKRIRDAEVGGQATNGTRVWNLINGCHGAITARPAGTTTVGDWFVAYDAPISATLGTTPRQLMPEGHNDG